ncbi:hypothetical protein [Marinobacter maritimus]|uniref:hypothetical protein n=1 Tax=Marinobacter maritimus TaxID=277961 RepID=UPI0011A6ECFE|nr:hypothetical protein [Marinobacter maritimus]
MKPETPIIPENIDAIGYAVIDSQPGPSYEDKLLQAMRKSRSEAYTLLVEQVYGRRLALKSRSSVGGEERKEVSSSIMGELFGFTTVTHGIDGKLYSTHLSIDAKKAQEIHKYYRGEDKDKRLWWR